jgi:hypothetical protein
VAIFVGVAITRLIRDRRVEHHLDHYAAAE